MLFFCSTKRNPANICVVCIYQVLASNYLESSHCTGLQVFQSLSLQKKPAYTCPKSDCACAVHSLMSRARKRGVAVHYACAVARACVAVGGH